MLLENRESSAPWDTWNAGVTEQVEVAVYEGDREVWRGLSRTPLEIGRQQDGEPSAPDLQNLGSGQRLVIAPVSARAVPRQALYVESLEDGGLRVTNIHPRLSFQVGRDRRPFVPGESVESFVEAIVTLPDNRVIHMAPSELPDDPPDSGDSYFRTITQPIESSTQEVGPVRLNELFIGANHEDQGRVAVDLVRAALKVVQKAAGSNEFFDAAVYAVATMIDLDRALVLMREGDQLAVRSTYVTKDAASESNSESEAQHYSRRLIERVLRYGKTVIYDPANYNHTADSSMMVLDRAVAAPILDMDRQVIGAIYGDRRIGSDGADTPIGDLEAALLDVMAGAVSSGIARQRQEAIRSNLTQFFSHEVAARLEHNEDLLAGRDAEVTVMFCDIRDFSTIAERVEAVHTIEWINDVLTELSQCVTNTDGVLVDYIGDELMAMWGAPAEQPDHARRACSSAVEMLKRIHPLRERWKEITPDWFGVGIGINTGLARVGNTGSKIKFKYGPLGNAVNLAKRVQGITKKLGVDALITGSTAAAIGAAFDHRRLAVVRPLGFAESVGLHELKSGADAKWRAMAGRYEDALASFDSGKLTDAVRMLATLIGDYPDDDACRVLLGRVVEALTRRDENFNPVWVMDSK